MTAVTPLPSNLKFSSCCPCLDPTKRAAGPTRGLPHPAHVNVRLLVDAPSAQHVQLFVAAFLCAAHDQTLLSNVPTQAAWLTRNRRMNRPRRRQHSMRCFS